MGRRSCRETNTRSSVALRQARADGASLCTPCDLAGGNENIISRAIQRVLGRWKECNRDGFADGKSKHICLIPDTLADFSDPVKRQLRQFKGEVVPIPRSIAAIYTYPRKVNASERYNVYDLDLPKPCDVEIVVQDGDDGFSVVRRRESRSRSSTATPPANSCAVILISTGRRRGAPLTTM